MKVSKTHFRKNPRVRNFSARDSGAGNGCANFVCAWDFLGVLSAGKPPMAIKFRVLAGVLEFSGRGGGSAN